MRFSERLGIVPVRDALQAEDMDQALINGLWNVLYTFFLRAYQQSAIELTPPTTRGLLKRIWIHFFKARIDDIGVSVASFTNRLKAWWLDDETMWWERYDLIEFIIASDGLTDEQRDQAVAAFNSIMERDRAAYRVIDRQVARLTSDQEIRAIEQAIADTGPLAGANHHLRQALSHLADRQNPDFANSIKESISAIESVCRVLTGSKKATLGDGLDRLESAGVPLHPALKESFKKMYGYTSDKDGIRHAAAEQPDVTLEDATYFLVSSSAFISLLIAKAGAAGITLVHDAE